MIIPKRTAKDVPFINKFDSDTDYTKETGQRGPFHQFNNSNADYTKDNSQEGPSHQLNDSGTVFYPAFSSFSFDLFFLGQSKGSIQPNKGLDTETSLRLKL